MLGPRCLPRKGFHFVLLLGLLDYIKVDRPLQVSRVALTAVAG